MLHMLTQIDCCHLNYAVGLLLDYNWNMDLPCRCHHRAYILQHSCRRGVLFLHPDIQYLPPLSARQQTYIPSRIPTTKTFA